MQRLTETAYSETERNQKNIRVGYIIEIDMTSNSIVFRSRKPDGTMQDFQARIIGHIGNLAIGTAIDFRYYNRSKTNTVLEVLGITPPEYVPDWARIRK